MNDYQKNRFCKLVIAQMFDNLVRKNICILGFSFKKDTGDIRFVLLYHHHHHQSAFSLIGFCLWRSESAAIDVAQFLIKEGANVFVYDPKAPVVEITKVSDQINCEKVQSGKHSPMARF